MTVPYAEIKWIKDRLTRLEDKMDKLARLCDKRYASQCEHDSTMMKYNRLHEGEIEDIYQRLQNIELKLFPNLSKDLDKLGGIIGEKPTTACNPLDRRPAWKRQPKKK